MNLPDLQRILKYLILGLGYNTVRFDLYEKLGFLYRIYIIMTFSNHNFVRLILKNLTLCVECNLSDNPSILDKVQKLGLSVHFSSAQEKGTSSFLCFNKSV